MVPDRVPIVQAAWWWIGLEFIGEVGSASAVFERFDPVGEAIEVGRCDLLARKKRRSNWDHLLDDRPGTWVQDQTSLRALLFE